MTQGEELAYHIFMEDSWLYLNTVLCLSWMLWTKTQVYGGENGHQKHSSEINMLYGDHYLKLRANLQDVFIRSRKFEKDMAQVKFASNLLLQG